LRKITKYVPIWSLCLIIFAIVSLPIHIAFLLNERFADFFNRYIAAGFRFFMAKLTGWYTLSVAEILLLGIPVILAIIIYLAYKASRKDRTARIRLVCGLFSIITFFYSSFIFTYSAGYRGSTLDEKLGLERVNVSASELYESSMIVVKELNKYADKVEYGEDHFANIPYSYKELNKKVNEAYKKASAKYDFLQDMSTNVKQIMLSEPMTYTHISGIYTFFTGEANLNVNYPDFNHAYTMAHEMAHQRGIARENEANFVAYLVLLESDDDFIRYSAYFNMYEYLTNALYSADKDLYKEILNMTDRRVIYELIAYSDFFDKYRENTAADISNSLNNSFLQSQGQTNGTRSYGLVVDLTVAYYKAENQK